MKMEVINGKQYVTRSAYLNLKKENDKLKKQVNKTSKPVTYVKG